MHEEEWGLRNSKVYPEGNKLGLGETASLIQSDLGLEERGLIGSVGIIGGIWISFQSIWRGLVEEEHAWSQPEQDQMMQEQVE